MTKLPEFRRASEIKPAQSVSACIYGRAKRGKTHFGGTAGDKTLVLNIGKGTETLLSLGFKKLVGANPIIVDVFERTSSSGIIDVPEAFDMMGDVIDHALITIPEQFDTIVIDEMTAFQRSALLKAIELNKRTGKSESFEKSKQYEVLYVEVQDYGEEMKMTEWFCATYIDKCKEANKNFIVLAHETEVFVKKSKAKMLEPPELVAVRPSFTGSKDPDRIPKLFDWVWRVETASVNAGGQEKTLYRMRTEGDEIIMAGTRHSGVFETVEKNPNFLAMINRVKNTYKEGL